MIERGRSREQGEKDSLSITVSTTEGAQVHDFVMLEVGVVVVGV
jgi:hypothetical protein